MYKILVVEDDPSINDLLKMNLTIAGYECDTASDGIQALTAVKQQKYDLALLDIMLPEVDGFELMPYMRKYHIPVIYLSAKSDVIDRVRGLRLGAEDYLVKPFHILELLVRIEKVLSRNHEQPKIISLCGVTVNEKERKVNVSGQEIEMKPMEYNLMLMFMKHPNMVLSREQLLHEVWGDDYYGETRTVDSHVAVLRKKLNWLDKIVTIHRVGYKLEAEK